MLALKGLLFIVAIFMGYFLPSIIAFVKDHHNKKSILILNLFLGWTALAWIVSLAMSFSKTDSEKAKAPVSTYIILPFILAIIALIMPNEQSKIEKSKDASEVKQEKPVLDDSKSIQELEKQKESEVAEVNLKLKPLLKKFKVEHDKIENNTFYSHFNNYQGKYLKENTVRIYMGNSDKYNWLRFQSLYNADDWLFIESFKVNIDGENFEVTPNSYREIERDTRYGGEIQEEIQMGVEGSLLQALEQITTDKPVIVRYIGKRYYKDKTLSKGEKQAIIDTLDLKRLMDLKHKHNLEIK